MKNSTAIIYGKVGRYFYLLLYCCYLESPSAFIFTALATKLLSIVSSTEYNKYSNLHRITLVSR